MLLGELPCALFGEIAHTHIAGRRGQYADVIGSETPGVPSFQYAGALAISVGSERRLSATDEYVRWLDLDTATAGARFVANGGDETHERTAFASGEDGVLLFCVWGLGRWGVGLGVCAWEVGGVVHHRAVVEEICG